MRILVAIGDDSSIDADEGSRLLDRVSTELVEFGELLKQGKA